MSAPVRLAESPSTGTARGGVSLAEALNRALADAMAADERVVVYGEDVGKLGGVFRVTDGLAERFGEQRCFDSPLAESGIVGTAIGMAMFGLRPVVELQFDGFSYPAFNQVVSHLAKLRYRSQGRLDLPVVIRIPYGGGIGSVEHHSESPEVYYAHTAGLKVVTPSTPSDAYALLRAAIDCPDPVVFLEPKRRYWEREDVTLPSPAVALGSAAVRREGRDVTVLAYGPTVSVALAAAEEAVAEGWSVEVVDVRSLSPLDEETIVASARRTGRVVVVQEAPRLAGYGAELAAVVGEGAFGWLEAPVQRVTGFDTPYPPARFEGWYLPDADRVLDAIAVAMAY